MIFLFLVTLLGMASATPWIDTGEGPNTCYVVNAQMEQPRPCKPEETRGVRR